MLTVTFVSCKYMGFHWPWLLDCCPGWQGTVLVGHALSLNRPYQKSDKVETRQEIIQQLCLSLKFVLKIRPGIGSKGTTCVVKGCHSDMIELIETGSRRVYD